MGSMEQQGSIPCESNASHGFSFAAPAADFRLRCGGNRATFGGLRLLDGVDPGLVQIIRLGGDLVSAVEPAAEVDELAPFAAEGE